MMTLTPPMILPPTLSTSSSVGGRRQINHAPVLVPDALLPEMVIPCIGPDGENVKFSASAVFSDPDGDPLIFTWEVKLGEDVVHSSTGVDLLDVRLHPGIYQVTLTADDDSGGITSAVGLVDIQADEPPTLSLSLSPDTINANNHKMFQVEMSGRDEHGRIIPPPRRSE